jgi:hypothetical protein
MIASDVIYKLQKLINDHGDQKVKIFDTDIIDFYDIIEISVDDDNDAEKEFIISV